MATLFALRVGYFSVCPVCGSRVAIPKGGHGYGHCSQRTIPTPSKYDHAAVCKPQWVAYEPTGRFC